MTVFLALYHGRKQGARWSARLWWERFADWAVRRATRSAYSHCELAIEVDGGLFDCYSSSIRDGGVRMKRMALPADKWRLFECNLPAAAVVSMFSQTRGAPYDFLGALGVLWGRGNAPGRFFCSEWCAQALGFSDPQRWTPGRLASFFGEGECFD